MRYVLIFTPLAITAALIAVFSLGGRPAREQACCECLNHAECTDLEVDSCVGVLEIPSAQGGGAPWRMSSLLGGEIGAQECASAETFVDFDEARAGCGDVCSGFVRESMDLAN